LNPGRYVGASSRRDDDENFRGRLQELLDEYADLSGRAVELDAEVTAAIEDILK
jgi:hypothetical protein